MYELLRTNNIVTLSFAQSLLKEAGIATILADENMSILEGSIGLLPKRLLVDAEHTQQARRLMIDAGLGNELRESENDC